jgi:acyl homoserine lactone synthase
MYFTRIYSASYNQLHSDTLNKLFRFRYDIFVKRLGWAIPHTDHSSSLETDQYDTSDAVYTIAEDAEGSIICCSRLIPTIRPYLLSEHFNFLCEGTLPSTYTTWEVSRFAAEAHGNTDLPVVLFKISLMYAWGRGANSVVAVTTNHMERYFKRKKIQAKRMGKPINCNGEKLVALEFVRCNDNVDPVVTMKNYRDRGFGNDKHLIAQGLQY